MSRGLAKVFSINSSRENKQRKQAEKRPIWRGGSFCDGIWIKKETSTKSGEVFFLGNTILFIFQSVAAELLPLQHRKHPTGLTCTV